MNMNILHQAKHPFYRFTLLLLWLGIGQLQAQESKKEPIPIRDIWASAKLFPQTVRGVNWMKDGAYYSSLEENAIIQYDIRSGEAVDTLYSGEAQELDIADYALSPSEEYILVQSNKESIYRRSFVAQYYHGTLEDGRLEALDPEGSQSYATFSPGEDKIAYVRDNNLYYKDLQSGEIVQVTQDGQENSIINGSTDWVYEEEFAITKAFFWSPDGKKLAYLKFDESAVPEYNMQMWGELYPEDYRYKYPKAGETNSTVRVFVYDLSTKKHKEIEIGAEKDQYIPRMQWTKDASLLSIRRLNRLQNHLEILHADVESGQLKTAYEEQNETYIEIYDDVVYLEGGKRFMISSEKDGFRHFYLYNMKGELINQVTEGDWEVSEFHGVDEQEGVLYYSSHEESPLENHFYRINLDGGRKKALTKRSGHHRINLSISKEWFLDYYSTANQPEAVSLKDTKKGKAKRELKKNAAIEDYLKSHQSSPVAFDQLKLKNGTELNYYMIKPADFDPEQEYPVLMFVYGGPGSQMVSNGWLGHNYYWFQHLAAKGYIVACVDNRGTGGRGTDFKKCTYGDLGKLELEDQLEAARMLADLDYVDENRLGIWGWSFGGYMTALCMTRGEGLFKMGISVAPVTNWRFYDTIYTERFLKTPQDNASGYDDNSPIFYAKGLKGEYLLIHGTGDDNVHFQNAIAFQDALIAANKQFETFYYPNRDHGIYGGITRYHLYKRMTRFVEENL